MSITKVLKTFVNILGIGLLGIILALIMSFIMKWWNDILGCLRSVVVQWIPEFICQLVPEKIIEFLSSNPTTSELLSILGIFATVSVTFLTLLFAIAAINASFRAGKNDVIDSGAYPLKLLIKVDLQSTALRTIIPQLIVTILVLVSNNQYSGLFWIFVLVILLYYLISTLWNTTNSVYYSIIQYNQDPQLNGELKELNNIVNNLTNNSSNASKTVSKNNSTYKPINYKPINYKPINYKPRAYDVYTVKKTLFPKLHRKIYKSIRKMGVKSLSKQDLVNKWDDGFNRELKQIVQTINKLSKNKSYLYTLKSPNVKKLLKKLRPKIQAPDKITKICLDMIYRDMGSISSSPSKEVLEECLVLLYTHKLYVESRQDERSKHNVRINRGCYANPDDTHMYMMFGYVLCQLGDIVKETQGSDNAIEYYNAAIDEYNCAKITNPTNKVAEINVIIVGVKKKIP